MATLTGHHNPGPNETGGAVMELPDFGIFVFSPLEFWFSFWIFMSIGLPLYVMDWFGITFGE
jgi:hypothetical protein